MKYFNEGITLSYAKTYDNSENYEPFNAFAYLTDKTKEKFEKVVHKYFPNELINYYGIILNGV